MERDASKLSASMRERFEETNSMSVEDYRGIHAERAAIRAGYAMLVALAPACITLSATGAAPLGLASTGRSRFRRARFAAGRACPQPALAQGCRLPLGMQMVGFEHADADLFARAAWVTSCLDSNQGRSRERPCR